MLTKMLIVCDSNIAEIGGHYLEYAIMVLSAAERMGYQPAMITNKSFKEKVPSGWKVLSTLEYNFWGRRSPADISSNNELTSDDRRWLRLKYSRYGLLWAAAGHLADTIYYQRLYPLNERAVEALTETVLIRALEGGDDDFNNSLFALGNSPHDISMPERRSAIIRARRSRLKAAVKRGKAMHPDERRAMIRLLTGARANDQGKAAVSELDDLAYRAAQSSSFLSGLQSALCSLAPGEGSHIVYPTISWAELKGLNQFFAGGSPAHRLDHHIILRRDAYSGDEETYEEQEWYVHSLRTGFAKFQTPRLGSQFHFYTDTAMLSRQYDRFDTAAFTPGPVPVDLVNRARWSPRPLTQRGNILLIQPVTSVRTARQFVDNLAIEVELGCEVEIHLIVADNEPLIAYLKDIEPGTKSFGSLFISHASAIDSIRAHDYDLVAINSSSPAFGHLWDDALDGGIPMIVGTSNWRYRALHGRANAYHDAALAGAQRLGKNSVSPGQWKRYVYSTQHTEQPRSTVHLFVSTDAATVTDLIAVPEANVLRLTFNIVDSLHVTVQFRDAGDQEIATSRYDVFAPAGPELHSLAFHVPENVAKAAVALCKFTGDSDVAVSKFNCAWLKSDRPIATIPGGGAFSDLADDLYNSVIGPLRQAYATREAIADSIRQANLDPAELARFLTDGSRPLDAAYLGDARKEKGYHHLPEVLRQLADRNLNRNVRLKTQVYYTGEYPEPDCLKASALLSLLPRDQITLIPEALDSARYAREIARSDIVLIPYSRVNYISRSSGIFTEALAAGIPSVIPAGTWMSAVLDGFAYEYHDHMIDRRHARRRQVEKVDFQLFSEGRVRQNVSLDTLRSARVQNGAVKFIHLPVESMEEYVWLTFATDLPNIFTRFDLSFQELPDGGASVYSVTRIIGGGLGCRYSILEKIPRAARSVWIGFYPAFVNKTYSLRDVQVSFISGSRAWIAPLPGGVSYPATSSDEEPRQIALALEQISTDYATYLDSAQVLQARWAAQNSGEQLVRMLEEAAETPPHAPPGRFVGSDWLEKSLWNRTGW